MKFLDSRILIRSIPLFFIASLFLLLTVPNPLLLNQEKEDQAPEVNDVENKANSNQIDLKDGGNSVKVEVNSQTQGESDSNQSETNTTEGTCKVTKNGVTEIVPANEVKIDEKSAGDLNIQVKCENKSSSNNKSSVNNKIEIKANSSP